jgi:hypothetical protein
MIDTNSSKSCLGCLTCRHQSLCQTTHQPDDWDGVSLTELIERFENAPPLVEYHGGEFIFYDENRRPYGFDASRTDTNAKLLEWIRHMTEKVWVTGPHINEFVRLAAEHLPRIKIDYSA